MFFVEDVMKLSLGKGSGGHTLKVIVMLVVWTRIQHIYCQDKVFVQNQTQAVIIS